jgi:hypothetical protein
MARLRFQVWLDIRDMKPENLAEIVGVPNQAVQRWLQRGIPQARVKDVAEALNISPAELQRFVDHDLSADLVDFAENVADRKRQRENGAEAAAKKPARSIFDERRKNVDRRRHDWAPHGGQCRRSNVDRRRLQYHRNDKNWWLHVDYLDEIIFDAVDIVEEVS